MARVMVHYMWRMVSRGRLSGLQVSFFQARMQANQGMAVSEAILGNESLHLPSMCLVIVVESRFVRLNVVMRPYVSTDR